MTKKWFSMFVLLVALVTVLGITASATNRLPEDMRVEKVNQFERALLPLDAQERSAASMGANQPRPLGQARTAFTAKGALVGNTYMDWQSHTGMNRVVEPNGPAALVDGVQFTFTLDNGTLATDRTHWGYNAWNATSNAFTGAGVIAQDAGPTSTESGYYPRIWVTNDGLAIVGGYDFTDPTNSPSQVQVVFDDVSLTGGGFGGINDGSVMNATIEHSGSFYPGQSLIRYPIIAVNEFSGTKIIYLALTERPSAAAVGSADRGHLAWKIYRKSGVTPANPDNSWTLVMTDSLQYVGGDIVTSSASTRVATCWVKGATDHVGAPDGIDNDVWYAHSATGAAGTWTKVNITSVDKDVDGFRAWFEVSAFFDSADKVHVYWNASPYRDGQVITTFQSRIFHWSEHNLASIYQVYNAEYGQGSCLGDWNVMNVGKLALGECNNRLYMAFTSWNDPAYLPVDGNGDPVDDCAATIGQLSGANGDIFITIAKDLQGKSWDKPRNLTATYTDNCDTLGALGPNPCADERYAAFSRYGYSDAELGGGLSWPTDATIVPAGSSHDNAKYLHMTYQLDYIPGSAALGSRSGDDYFSRGDIRWIRMACVAPVVAANLDPTPDSIWFPAWGKPSVQKDTTIRWDNVGNSDATISAVTLQEVSSTPPGATNWLGQTGLSVGSVIPEAGFLNQTIQLNKAGIINAGPRVLRGRVILTYGPPAGLVDTIHIRYTVADTVVGVIWDTLTTACLSLTVSSNGNMGNSGVGNANMNYVAPTECDVANATPGARGDASVYLYDGSPVILRNTGTDPSPVLTASWAIFADGYASENGFKPVPGFAQTQMVTSNPKFDAFHSGTFVTIDSLVKVEKTWFAPKGLADSCRFIIQRMRAFPYTIANSVSGLAVAEAIDWDVPSDTLTVSNIAGNVPASNLVWMRGFNSADTVTDCADNSLRYAGMAMISQHLKNCTELPMHSGYVLRNDSFVQLNGTFVPAELWSFMKPSGFTSPYGSNALDLHGVLVYRNATNGLGWTLPSNDTLTVWTALATTYQGGLTDLNNQIARAKAFWGNNKAALGETCLSCCIGTTGNVNMSGIVDLGDLSLLVAYLTVPAPGKPTLPCVPEANINATGIIDLGDLSLLVAYLTVPAPGKPNLPNCP